ncbi:hypothetical protein GCM10009127_15640 [Alteraurantiacibacter aestuarii]|uniref:Uncharacterized protein n=1 Tax=Alteraurantiacibacter aestuarii TaxID=650004 RepID=A0A844ZLF3_9SPHN|nr:hypothetical protein [Alteraurantiacibacter aestuarii]MXO87850.1 hypothetical protein [Alteraurantiacibacter aestuarii]
MHLRSISALFIGTALLAACSSGEDVSEEEVQAPEPVLTSTPVATAAPDGSPLAEGQWTISEDANGASASFGPAGSDALVVIACTTASRALSMTVAGSSDGTQPYVIEAGGTAARLDMVSTGGTLPMMRADIARDAPVFGGFVMPGQAVSITAPDGSILRLPTAPGIRRVFEACA